MKKLAFVALVALLGLPVAIVATPLAVGSALTSSAPARTTLAPASVIVGTNDTSPPLDELVGTATPARPTEGEEEGEGEGLAHNLFPGRDAFYGPDTSLQTEAPGVQIPAPMVNFQGIANNKNPSGPTNVRPPDVNADVGPKHIVETVNLSIAVYNKNGVLASGYPKANNALFAGFTAGPVCRDTNDGDPVVHYDQLADRWLVSQFALPNFPSGPYYQCIAVSQTGDPTGAWHRYQFQYPINALNDYPKFGVWPDAYYASFNQFKPSGGGFSWAGAGAIAYERAKMLNGQVAKQVYFNLGPISPNSGGLLPSDLNGKTLPPKGAPNFFVDIEYDDFGFATDRLQLWKFHVDFATPANSTFTGPTVITPNAFGAPLCGFANCVPQKGTTQKLDTLSDRGMYRLNYRNFGSPSRPRESLVFNHSINVGSNRAGIRWYELKNPSAGVTLGQQGTFAPADGLHRWMGSANQDRKGNIAVGYSVSSATTFPSIRYAGRKVSDPAGQLSAGEATIINGPGSQTSPEGRWGDYSSMSIDPIDDCTFWYAGEYMRTAGNTFADWATRISSFKFNDCISAISIKDASVTEGNSGTKLLTFTLSLNRPSAQDVKVKATTADSTALAGSDYVAKSSIVTFAPGRTTATFSVTVNGDTALELNETFFVNLTAPQNGTIADTQAVGTITNDD